MLKTRQYNDNFNGGDLLKISQAAKALRVSRGTIYKYVSLNLLSAKIEETGTDEIGKSRELKFKPEEIERFSELLKRKRKRGQRLV